ncbi:MAG: nickel pincer cofactor biosynthesis protein LarC [Clostridium sp.]|nr:nickel pincer cofactor biosynthesis protein LarC [Clostridium sp.]
MGKTLYLECNSGISGDMTVAALLDLGADKEKLEKALKSLPVQGFEIEISRVKKAGLDVCDFNVKLDKEHENHDHDMEYLHGHEHEYSHEHCGETEHVHSHEHCSAEEHTHNHEHNETEDHVHLHEHAEAEGHTHSHEHEHSHGEHSHPHEHHHPHEHRGLPEILEIIAKADITDRAREMAVKIFRVLAKAEAKAHGTPEEQVHFHEVGAVDSIVDIVSAAVCLDDLNITEVIVPFLCEGKGTVRCQHGILPVPVPAVTNILEAHHIPVEITEVQGELVTPTGAAIVAAAATSFKLPKKFVIQKIGMGAGKRNYERPSLLRAMLIEEKSEEEKGEGREEKEGEEAEKKNCGCSEKDDVIYRLETNIDDCTGEALGYVMERLLQAGARDVHFIPVYMKKNRPACELVVICDENKIAELEQIIFQETTTIGIRRTKMERSVLPRKSVTVALKEGEITAKKCTLPNGQERYYPEYGSAVRLAEEKGLPLQQVLASFAAEIGKRPISILPERNPSKSSVI